LSLADELNSELVTVYIRERVLSHIIVILWRALQQGQPLRRYQQHLLPLGDFTPVVLELAGTTTTDTWPAVVGGVVGDLLSESFEVFGDEQISLFERKMANYLTAIARDAKMQTAGPERVFSFLAGFQAEIQNMKLVINGRLNHVDQALLRQRVRECYV